MQASIGKDISQACEISRGGRGDECYFAKKESVKRSFSRGCSANARELFPAQHIDDAAAADAALQHDEAAGSLFYFSDAD